MDLLPPPIQSLATKQSRSQDRVPPLSASDEVSIKKRVSFLCSFCLVFFCVYQFKYIICIQYSQERFEEKNNKVLKKISSKTS